MTIRKIFNDIMDSGNRSLHDLDLIRYKSEFTLTEGLIMTHDISKSIGILHRKGYKVTENSPLTVRDRKFGVHQIKSDQLSDLLNLTNNLGWFPAIMIGNKNGEPIYSGKFNHDVMDRFDSISLIFEAKYDVEIEDVQRYYYHVTLQSKLNKILKVGLTPKSGSKISSHPERVYLANNIASLNKLRKNMFFKPLPGDEFVNFRIDTELIPSYFRIFADSNFIDHGVYTLNTIPPIAINVEE